MEKHQVNAMAEIVSYAQMGTKPEFMGMGPFYAVKKLIEQTGFSYSQIGLFELNEAFAAQSLAVIKKLAKYFEVTETELLSKTNVKGGGISLGHPIGASGARIIVTLVHTMQERNIEYGIASLCIGGGMGTAILVKNLHYKN